MYLDQIRYKVEVQFSSVPLPPQRGHNLGLAGATSLTRHISLMHGVYAVPAANGNAPRKRKFAETAAAVPAVAPLSAAASLAGAASLHECDLCGKASFASASTLASHRKDCWNKLISVTRAQRAPHQCQLIAQENARRGRSRRTNPHHPTKATAERATKQESSSAFLTDDAGAAMTSAESTASPVAAPPLSFRHISVATAASATPRLRPPAQLQLVIMMQPRLPLIRIPAM